MFSFQTPRIQLVDHENTGRIDFASISDDTTVILFFGGAQNSVPRSYTAAAKKLGSRYVEIDISGQGKNALDFHIAFYLGQILTQNAEAECVILSNDKGFDPLVNHLCERGFVVARTPTRPEAIKAVTRVFDPSKLHPDAKQAYDWLHGIQKNKRPRKRKSLINYLHSHFGKKFTESSIVEMVSELENQHAISHNSQNLSYHF